MTFSSSVVAAGNSNGIPASEKGAANGVAPLDSSIKLSEQYFPDNVAVNSVSVPQGTTSEINNINPAGNRIFLDISKNRFRVGNDDYAKYSETTDKAIVPPFISGNYYALTCRGRTSANSVLNIAFATVFDFFILSKPLTLSSISIIVNTAANRTIQLAIYSVNIETLKPVSRLTNIVTISCSATGVRSASVSITLSPGIYALGELVDTTGSGSAFVNVANSGVVTSEDSYFFGSPDPSFYGFKTIWELSTATLPATINPANVVLTQSLSSRPFYYFKAA